VCVCILPFFSDFGYYTPSLGSSCTSCAGIIGLLCASGLASVEEGYWAYQMPVEGTVDIIETDSSSQQQLLYLTTPCPPGFCPGTALQMEDSSNTVYCTYPRLNSRSNTLCGQCEEGFLAWGDGCVSCSGVSSRLVMIYLFASLALVLFLLRSSGSAAGPLGVLLYFVQTAALEVGSVSHFISWIQVVNFGASSTSSCLAPWTPEEQTLFSIIIPIMLCIEVIAVAALHWMMECAVRRPRQIEEADAAENASAGHGCVDALSKCTNFLCYPMRRLAEALRSLLPPFSLNSYIGCCVSVFCFCYTQVSLACVRYLYCVRVKDELLVFAFPSVNCRSSAYHTYLWPVILTLILFIVGMPLACIVLLYRNRTVLSSSQLALRGGSIGVDSSLIEFISRWGSLFAMYEHRAWFWQPMVLIRRLAFVLVSVLLFNQPSVRFMVFLLLNFASLQLHALVRPFGVELLNHAAMCSYGLLVLLSAMLTAYLPPYSLVVQILSFILIVPPAAVGFIIVVRHKWESAVSLWQRIRRNPRSRQTSPAAISAVGSMPNSIVEKGPNADSSSMREDAFQGVLESPQAESPVGIHKVVRLHATQRSGSSMELHTSSSEAVEQKEFEVGRNASLPVSASHNVNGAPSHPVDHVGLDVDSLSGQQPESVVPINVRLDRDHLESTPASGSASSGVPAFASSPVEQLNSPSDKSIKGEMHQGYDVGGRME
jgi:hypothetical protein